MTKYEYLIEQERTSENIWFHGTKSKFDIFDLSYFGETDDGWWGVGVYFHSNIENAKAYGINIIKASFKTDKILNLPTYDSGQYLYNILNDLGLNIPSEYKNYSAMNIISNIGKQEFTNFIKAYFDVMVINYTEGTKEAIVFNTNILEIF